MKKSYNGLFLGFGLITALIATVLVTTGGFTFRLLPISATNVTGGQITFNASNLVSSTANGNGRYDTRLQSKTSTGTLFTLVVENSLTQASSKNSGSTFASLQTKNDGIISRVYMTSTYMPNTKVFQKINSISVTSNTAYSRTVRFYLNGQSSYDSISVAASSTGTFYTENSSYLDNADARSFEIQYYNNNTLNLEVAQIVINYDCSTSYVETVTLSSIGVTTSPKTSFNTGDEFVFNGIITATYSDSSTLNVTSYCSFSGYDMETEGVQTVTVTYTEAGITKSATYNITLTAKTVEILTGEYKYFSRTTTSSSTSWTDKMTLEFYSDGTCLWHNVRTIYQTDAKVTCTYTAENNGTNIEISMVFDSYDFKKSGEENHQASTWSGGSLDRPLYGGFATNAYNNTGTLSLDKNTLTIDMYKYESSAYTYCDTFTFKLA